MRIYQIGKQGIVYERRQAILQPLKHSHLSADPIELHQGGLDALAIESGELVKVSIAQVKPSGTVQVRLPRRV